MSTPIDFEQFRQEPDSVTVNEIGALTSPIADPSTARSSLMLEGLDRANGLEQPRPLNFTLYTSIRYVITGTHVIHASITVAYHIPPNEVAGCKTSEWLEEMVAQAVAYISSIPKTDARLRAVKDVPVQATKQEIADLVDRSAPTLGLP